MCWYSLIRGTAVCVDVTLDPSVYPSIGLLAPSVGQALGSGDSAGPRPTGSARDTHTCDTLVGKAVSLAWRLQRRGEVDRKSVV